MRTMGRCLLLTSARTAASNWMFPCRAGLREERQAGGRGAVIEADAGVGGEDDLNAAPDASSTRSMAASRAARVKRAGRLEGCWRASCKGSLLDASAVVRNNLENGERIMGFASMTFGGNWRAEGNGLGGRGVKTVRNALSKANPRKCLQLTVSDFRTRKKEDWINVRNRH